MLSKGQERLKVPPGVWSCWQSVATLRAGPAKSSPAPPGDILSDCSRSVSESNAHQQHNVAEIPHKRHLAQCQGGERDVKKYYSDSLLWLGWGPFEEVILTAVLPAWGSGSLRAGTCPRVGMGVDCPGGRGRSPLLRGRMVALEWTNYSMNPTIGKHKE